MGAHDEEALATTQLDDLAPAPDPMVGRTLADRYRVLRKIGGGGMGAVYEAEHRIIGKRVAIKVLHPQFASDADVVRRFLNEARAASSIEHPGILAALDMGRTDDGMPFLVLELLKGSSLDRVIRDGGPMPIGRAVRIAAQCASALEAAHARGIVHRDLKPENVFLLEGDQVKVLDFGISKLGAKVQSGQGTRTGAVLGTPYYMAPEQMRDASRVDVRADVWALGVMLWEMLAGRVPFTGGSLPDLMLKVCTEPPPSLRALRPDVPDALLAAIDTALAKEADGRFASMRALADAIARFAHDDDPARVTAPGVTPISPQPTPMSAETKIPDATLAADRPRSRATPIAFAVLAAAAIVALAVVLTGGGDDPTSSTLGARELTPAPLPPTLEPPEPQAPSSAPERAPSEPVRADAPPRDSPPREEARALDVPAPTIVLAVTSDARGAEAEVRGAWHPLPYRASIARSLESEEIAVRAPGRTSVRRRVVLDRDQELAVTLERAGAGARPTAEPSSGPPPDPGPTTAPPDLAPEPARPRATGVYTGPSGDIPDEI